MKSLGIIAILTLPVASVLHRVFFAGWIGLIGFDSFVRKRN